MPLAFLHGYLVGRQGYQQFAIAQVHAAVLDVRVGRLPLAFPNGFPFMGEAGQHAVQVVKYDVLGSGHGEQAGGVVPGFENAPCPRAGQVDRPKQLAGQLVEALAYDVAIEKESSLHATFQLRVHGQEELVAM